MHSDFIFWWCTALVCVALVCRYFYSRDQRIARIFMWVLLGIFLTPIGAVLVYLVLSVINRRSTAAASTDTGTT